MCFRLVFLEIAIWESGFLGFLFVCFLNEKAFNELFNVDFLMKLHS